MGMAGLSQAFTTETTSQSVKMAKGDESEINKRQKNVFYWISFGKMVTRLAWIAHKFVSSNNDTRYASEASCNANNACDWKRRSPLMACEWEVEGMGEG